MAGTRGAAAVALLLVLSGLVSAWAEPIKTIGRHYWLRENLGTPLSVTYGPQRTRRAFLLTEEGAIAAIDLRDGSIGAMT